MKKIVLMVVVLLIAGCKHRHDSLEVLREQVDSNAQATHHISDEPDTNSNPTNEPPTVNEIYDMLLSDAKSGNTTYGKKYRITDHLGNIWETDEYAHVVGDNGIFFHIHPKIRITVYGSFSIVEMER